VSYLRPYRYEGGAQFQLADALRGWGQSPDNQRAWFAIHSGNLVLMNGNWPPDFPSTLP
jgi:hypothetical protein